MTVKKSLGVKGNCLNVCEDGSGRGARSAAAAANKRGPALGAVGLPFEKMQLVRQKKEEIEKVWIRYGVQWSAHRSLLHIILSQLINNAKFIRVIFLTYKAMEFETLYVKSMCYEVDVHQF